MKKKQKIKLTLPTNLTIFDSLKEKSDYFLDLAFEQTIKESDRRIYNYNNSNWFVKFWDKKVVKEFNYSDNKKYKRLSSDDYWADYDEMNSCLIKGYRSLYRSEFLSRIHKTITFCRENDVSSIEMEDSDVNLLKEIEKEYNDKY